MSMSALQPLSLGISSFRSLRIKRAVYVDKTHMIRSLADPSGEGDKWFLARPRRFGKSLLISTFESLFKYGLRDFEGLSISKEWTDRCYDVVRLDFSEIPSCRDPDAFGVGFRALIAIKFKPLGFEAEPLDGAFFQKFSGWLEARERRSLVLLIDECDAPLTHSIEDPTLFREIEEKLRPFFSAFKPRSDCLRFLFMTGITRFGYAQALTGFDGVTDISFDPAYGTLLGFTDAELERCFADRLQSAAERLGLSMEKLRARLKASYGGYCFDAEGQTEVYSPWSVLSFLRAPELGFRNHWWLTAGAPSDLLKKHVRHRMSFACRSGRFDGTVKVPFSRLESALQWEDLESPQILQQTGCLSVKGSALSGEVELGYPNLEVAASLAQLAEEELTRGRGCSRPDLVRALSRGCVSTVADYLNTVVSTMDGRAFSLGSETECRFLLQMVLMKVALQPRVEVPSPDGRTRLEVLAGDRHWVFEVRFAQGAHDFAGQLEAGARRMCESSGRDRRHGNECLHAALIYDSANRRFVAQEAGRAVERAMIKSKHVLSERVQGTVMKQALKQVPYGEPSWVYLREAGYAFVDKTRFIQALEQCGSRFPFIVRPRRFGKSLFANMLIAYYDKAAAGDFDQNFSGTWIGEHPTSLANKFLVLKLDFSGIDGGDGLIDNFLVKVKSGLLDFVKRYLPDDPQMQELLNASWTSPAALLTSFFSLVGWKLRVGIYLIIDEYDQFAQEILSKDPERFRAMTGAEGFLKAFYACIKDAAASELVKRTFITGVTSISLDSMTSGFNLATNITHDADFAGMMGFTDDELRRLIPQIVDLDRYGHSVDEVFERMKVLYDGYRFSSHSDVTVFNSSMCLYYLRALAKTNSEPEDLLDPSFSVDLSKIDGILSLGNKVEVESIVKDVLLDKPIESAGGFTTLNLNASAGFSKPNVLTALTFMGFLTFSSVGSRRMKCPNLVVKDLFYRYWFWRFERMQDFAFPSDSQKFAIEALATGDVRPILEFVSETLSQSVGVHVHAHVDETAIQFALAMALNTSAHYRVTLEEEALGVGFTDLMLKPSSENSDIPGWIIELKYVKKSETTEQIIAAKIAEAEEQLNRYSGAENIKCIPNLRRVAAVFSGTALKGVKVF